MFVVKKHYREERLKDACVAFVLKVSIYNMLLVPIDQLQKTLMK